MQIWTLDIGNFKTKAVLFEGPTCEGNCDLYDKSSDLVNFTQVESMTGDTYSQNTKLDKIKSIPFTSTNSVSDQNSKKSKSVSGNQCFTALTQRTMDFCEIDNLDGEIVYCTVSQKPNLTNELTAQNAPLKISYKTPETLGADRIAGALGAINDFTGTVLLVDAGTYITCDLLDADQGIFLGGAILMGLGLIRDSFNKASGLSKYTSEAFENLGNEHAYPGKSTIESLNSGIYMQTVGAIENYAKRADHIVFTGGDGAVLNNIFKANYDPILTNKGLLLFHLHTGVK